MKIAIITPYKSYPGGVETVNGILDKILEDEGHTVTYITSDNYHPKWWEKIAIKVVGLPWITAKRFRKQKTNFDLVICNGEFGLGINHENTICLFHGSYLGLRNYLPKQWNIIQRINLTRLAIIQRLSARKKYIVAVSEFVSTILKSQKIKVDKIICNAIDVNMFSKEKRESKSTACLFVGANNHYAKGIDILEGIAEKGVEIHCASNSKVPDRLIWLGSKNYTEMPKIYSQYEIFVFPSRFEGLSMAPLEAMASGMPVIISNVGLGPNLKKFIPDFVVDDSAPESYIEKINLIKKDYEKYSRLAFDYVSKYHNLKWYREQWLKTVNEVSNAKMGN